MFELLILTSAELQVFTMVASCYRVPLRTRLCRLTLYSRLTVTPRQPVTTTPPDS